MLERMIAPARSQSIIAGTGFQWVVGERFKLTLQGQYGRTLFVGGEGLRPKLARLAQGEAAQEGEDLAIAHLKGGMERFCGRRHEGLGAVERLLAVRQEQHKPDAVLTPSPGA